MSAAKEDASEQRIISYFSAGSTSFTEFKVNQDGEGEYYDIEAGQEHSYSFNLDQQEVEEYRDRLWNEVTNGSPLKKEYSTSSTDLVLYRDGEHNSGRLTPEGKEIVNEMLDAFEENKE